MSALQDSGSLFHPSWALRRPTFWAAGAALLLLLVGLLTVALPESLSGTVVWSLDADHGLRLADAIGAALLITGSALTWITILIWQWQQMH